MADNPTEAVVVEPSQTSDLPGLTPQEALKAAQAQEELRKLQLRQVADLIPVLRQLVEGVLQRLDETLKQAQTLISQILVMHDLQMKDAETQLEITKVLQSTLVVLDQVEHEGILEANKLPPKGL
jgi:parvulin-like peptidyl-prolyl isomerase